MMDRNKQEEAQTEDTYQRPKETNKNRGDDTFRCNSQHFAMIRSISQGEKTINPNTLVFHFSILFSSQTR